jgi:hypothetical protein
MGRRWAVVSLGCCMFWVLAGSAPNSVTLEVSVRSMADSKPIRGAEIVVERAVQGSTKSTPGEDVDDLVITRAESNERGEIVLRELPAVPMRLKLRAEGYVSPAIGDPRGSRVRLELLLPPAIEATGIVVDETGKPAAGVQVELPYVVDAKGRVVVLGEPLSATTNDAGEFRIKGAPQGFAKFKATAKGSVLAVDDTTRPLSNEPVKLTIRPPCTLRVDFDAPLHRRGQYTIVVGKELPSGAVIPIQERPGADRGVITFIDLAAGKYVVSAAIPNREAETFTAHVEVSVGQTTDVRLTSKKRP